MGVGTLLVVGSGRCVWDDLDRYLPASEKGEHLQRRLLVWSYTPGNTVMAVNEIGVHLHAEVKHWVSLHPNHLITRALRRSEYGYPPAVVELHSNKPWEDKNGKIQHVWPIPNTGALSGLFAAQVGLLMGFDRIVLAGCPMDGSGVFHDPPGVGGVHADEHIMMASQQAIARNPELRNRVRSMSGNTRKWLGEPEPCAV